MSFKVGRDGVLDMATRYGLDGTGIEYRWGRNFPHPSRPVLGLTQPPTQWVQGRSRGEKRQGCGADRPSLSSPAVKEIVALRFYSPSWP